MGIFGWAVTECRHIVEGEQPLDQSVQVQAHNLSTAEFIELNF